MLMVCQLQHFLVAGGVTVSDDRFEFRQVEVFSDAANFFVAITIATFYFSRDKAVLNFQFCGQA